MSGWLQAVVLALWGGFFGPPGVPKLDIAVAPAVECHDVTPAALAGPDREYKLVEARFRVNATCRGSADFLGALFVEFESPKRRVVVVDYCPRTTLGHAAGAKLVVEAKSEEAARGRLSASYLFLPARGAAAADVESRARTLSRVETYTELPPLEALTESGRFADDFGVRFKLRQTARHKVTGEKVYSCLLSVPARWEGDWVYCTATGHDKREGGAGSKEYGRVYRPVGLYLSGAKGARAAAEALAAASARFDGSQERLREQIDAMNALYEFSYGK